MNQSEKKNQNIEWESKMIGKKSVSSEQKTLLGRELFMSHRQIT